MNCESAEIAAVGHHTQCAHRAAPRRRGGDGVGGMLGRGGGQRCQRGLEAGAGIFSVRAGREEHCNIRSFPPPVAAVRQRAFEGLDGGRRGARWRGVHLSPTAERQRGGAAAAAIQLARIVDD